METKTSFDTGLIVKLFTVSFISLEVASSCEVNYGNSVTFQTPQSPGLGCALSPRRLRQQKCKEKEPNVGFGLPEQSLKSSGFLLVLPIG